jgi:nucleoside phosphorylase
VQSLVVVATELERSVVPRGVDTLVCGLGPVEAAIATGAHLAAHRPEILLQAGIAGAHEISPPALVLGSEAVYTDILGDEHAMLDREGRIAPDHELLERAKSILPEAFVVPIATTARVGAADGYAVEAMEGYAVLRAAALAGVPALEIRAISNSPGEIDRSLWKIDDALAALADGLARLVDALG